MARFEIVDPLASLAFTVTWNDRVPVVVAATEVKVQVTVPAAKLTLQFAVDPQVAELATYLVPTGTASVTTT